MIHWSRLFLKLMLVVSLIIFINFNSVSASEDIILKFSPSSVSSNATVKGEFVKIELILDNHETVSRVQLDVNWNSSLLELDNVQEGNFTKSFGASIFRFNDTSTNQGHIDDLYCELFIVPSNIGNWSLAILNFKVKQYGSSSINTSDSGIFAANYSIQTHYAYSGNYDFSSPDAQGPRVYFFSDRYWYYVYENVTLNATVSEMGYDNLPYGNETFNPIDSYIWELDYGEDGSVEETLYEPVISFIPSFTGNISVTLTVIAPDLFPPSSLDYLENSSITHVIHIVQGDISKKIDVYTDRGGEGAFNCSEDYGVSEDVYVSAYVTYNDAPQSGKLVLFEVVDCVGNIIAHRTIETDINGIANFSFQLPYDINNPESFFGKWSITAIVDLAGGAAQDTVDFQYGYLDSLICFDIFTDRGGEGPGTSGDVFGPQEHVTVYGYVCYNGAPHAGKDVKFDLIDPTGTVWATRTITSGQDGLAVWRVRLPWDSGDPEQLFGTWTIIGKVDIAEKMKTDILNFEFNYLVEITNVMVYDNTGVDPEISKNSFFTVSVELTNNRNALVPAIVTINGYDTGYMVFNHVYISAVLPERGVQVVSSEIRVPTWVFIGPGIAYVNTYSNIPFSYGIPFCPESSAILHIIQ